MVQLNKRMSVLAASAGILAVAAVLLFVSRGSGTHSKASAWQRHATPGALSAAHARLQDDCASCHTAVKGADDSKCIGCHAGDTALVQRQPTAFHAGIRACAQCHIEHQGANADLRRMDHVTLARLGLGLLGNNGPTRASTTRIDRATSPILSPLEGTLNCAACHSTKQPHSGLFGSDCANCHSTTQWTVAEFSHPSPRSTDCAQCHQAPPSHYMMHFEMVSKQVARQELARTASCCGPVRVNECQRCHQTTSWNDIKGVGWYKHH